MELGITSPLTQTGACKFIKAWLVDTSTIYRVGMVRTGTVVTALALGNIVIGGVMMAMNHNDPWAGLGLWTGFSMTACGIVCLIMRRNRPKNILSGLSATCLLGFITSLVSMATSVYNLWAITDDPGSRYPKYIMDLPQYTTSLYAMNGCLLTLSIFQIVFTFWCLCLSVGYVCPCLRMPGSSIFTIMVEEDPMDRPLEQDQDTEMSAFTIHNRNGSAPNRTLQIQSNWLQNAHTDTELTR